MLKFSTAIASTNTDGYFTDNLAKETGARSIHVKLIQWNCYVTLVLGKSLCHPNEADTSKAKEYGNTLQKNRVKLSKLKNSSLLGMAFAA